jgi:hypothetical protein
MSLMLNLC